MFFRPYKRQGKRNSLRLCMLNIMKSRGSNYKSAAGDVSTQACHFVCKRIESSVLTGTTLTVILNSLQRVRLSSQTDKYPTSFPGCLILSLPWSERERQDWRERENLGRTSLIKMVLDRLYSRKWIILNAFTNLFWQSVKKIQIDGYQFWRSNSVSCDIFSVFYFLKLIKTNFKNFFSWWCILYHSQGQVMWLSKLEKINDERHKHFSSKSANNKKRKRKNSWSPLELPVLVFKTCCSCLTYNSIHGRIW